MISRVLIIFMISGLWACSTATSGDRDPMHQNSGDDALDQPPLKSDRARLTGTEWANQFFLTQIYDDYFNAQGVKVDVDSNNCGPASLAILLRYQGMISLSLSAERAIDHARAMMYADYPNIDASTLSESATLSDEDGLVLVDDDSSPVYFDLVDDAPSITQGLLSNGATPTFGATWSALSDLLDERGALIAHGHITKAWRRQFSSDYGASNPGAVPHFITLFPSSTPEVFIVCDPMHRGGAVLMRKSELGVFFRSPVSVYDSTIRVVTL
jgi:hypothetical protein